MRGTFAIIIGLTITACTTSHGMDVGHNTDTGIDANVLDGGGRDSAVPGDAGSDVRSHPRCGGRDCGPGELCCFLDGACFDPALDTCGEEPPAAGVCFSNADCAEDEFCFNERGLCLAPGTCLARDAHGCGGEQETCGCDGRTYESPCAAERAGVRATRYLGACGSTGFEPSLHPPTCGSDADCSGTSCCLITGLCLPADCPDCCFDTTEFEGRWPCGNDAYCHRFDPSTFCNGPACEGPGTCLSAPSSCDGTLDPICGCDGLTYTNASCATRARVRPDHPGECDSTDE
jgi:hypothetical protein